MFPHASQLVRCLFSKHYHPLSCLPRSFKDISENSTLSSSRSSFLEQTIIYHCLLRIFEKLDPASELHSSVADYLVNFLRHQHFHSSTKPLFSVQQAHEIRKLVENELLLMHDDIVSFVEPSELQHSLWTINVMKNKLVDTINELKTLSQRSFSQFNKLFTCIISSLFVMSNIKTTISNNNDELFTSNLSKLKNRSNAVLAKMKLLKYQYLLETYDTDAIQALSCIRSEILTILESLDIELKSVVTDLSLYSRTGDQYNQIVADYSRLLSKKDELNWALSQL
ncbi:hypothetical protein P9112_011886 [Eukaryota sp. TZLM1-RC]